MGKTKIKIVDDSTPEEDKKEKKTKGPVKMAQIKVEKSAKSEHNEAVGESVILEGGQRPVESDQKDAIASLQHDNKEPDKSKKSTGSKATTKSKKIRSKKYQEALKQVDPNQKYPLP